MISHDMVSCVTSCDLMWPSCDPHRWPQETQGPSSDERGWKVSEYSSSLYLRTHLYYRLCSFISMATGIRWSGRLSGWMRWGEEFSCCALMTRGLALFPPWQVVEGAPYVTHLDVMDEHNCDFCAHGGTCTTVCLHSPVPRPCPLICVLVMHIHALSVTGKSVLSSVLLTFTSHARTYLRAFSYRWHNHVWWWEWSVRGSQEGWQIQVRISICRCP